MTRIELKQMTKADAANLKIGDAVVNMANGAVFRVQFSRPLVLVAITVPTTIEGWAKLPDEADPAKQERRIIVPIPGQVPS